MPDSDQNSLINIEEDFRRLLHHLSVYQSHRLKITLLTQFLYQLSRRDNPVLFQSYYQELLPYLQGQVTSETLLFRPIDYLLKLNDVMLSARELCPEETGSSDYQNVFETVERSIAKTYFYIGEWDVGFRYLWNGTDTDWYQDIINDEEGAEAGSKMDQFDQFVLKVERKEGIPSQVVGELHQINQDWKHMAGHHKKESVWTLLTEQQPDTGVFNHPMSIGTIKPLSLRLTLRPSDADEDLMRFNNKTMSYNDLIHQQTQDALTAARKQYFPTSQRSLPLYKCMFSYPDKLSFYSGDSAGLAMSLLTLAGMSHIHAQKFRYSFKQNIAVTGPVDLLGNIRPISNKALKTKLETMFFSPFDCAVIPEKNLASTNDILGELKERYPNRRLKIIPVNTIGECLNESRVVHKEMVSIREKITRKSKRAFVFGAVTIILVCFLSVIYFFNRDTNPSSLDINEKTLTVYNNSNKKLWQYEFSSSISYSDQFKPSKFALSKYIIDDLDGDGYNEVVIGFGSNANKAIDGSIYYFTADGSLKWRFHNHQKMQFGKEIMDDYYNAGMVMHYDFEDDGQEEIVAVFNNVPWYPCRLVVMDLEGNILEEYWNAGYITWVTFTDIDKDGKKEIIFGGTNNDYDQAIMGVLEYGSIEGHSPQDDSNYIPEGIARGNERFYIRFPVLNGFIFSLAENVRMLVTHIFDLGKGHLEVRVSDGLSNSGSLFYTLDSTMAVEKIGLADGFIHEYFNRNGRNFYDDFQPEYIDKYLSELEYWDGDKWVSEPAENKYWEKTQ